VFFVANRILIPAVVFLLFPMVGNAVEGVRLVCDEPVYQFGRVDQTAVVRHIFVVRNDGDTTFVAGMPRATCSCTQARLNKRMIGPGESAELAVTFTAERRAGEQKKVIYLPPSDSDVPVIKFYIQGFVEGGGQSD
jgi:hypothetical protein